MNTKSALWSAYNKARNHYKDARVNRALGIIQGEKYRPYITTIKTCSCKDSLNGHTCKHRIALMIIVRTIETMNPIEIEISSDKVIFDGIAVNLPSHIVANALGYIKKYTHARKPIVNKWSQL